MRVKESSLPVHDILPFVLVVEKYFVSAVAFTEADFEILDAHRDADDVLNETLSLPLVWRDLVHDLNIVTQTTPLSGW